MGCLHSRLDEFDRISLPPDRKLIVEHLHLCLKFSDRTAVHHQHRLQRFRRSQQFLRIFRNAGLRYYFFLYSIHNSATPCLSPEMFPASRRPSPFSNSSAVCFRPLSVLSRSFAGDSVLSIPPGGRLPKKAPAAVTAKSEKLKQPATG